MLDGVAFAGTAPFAARILDLILATTDHPFRPVLVVSQPDRRSGRGRKITPTPVAQVAAKNSLELIQPENYSSPEVADVLRSHDVSTVLVAAYGQIVKPVMLDQFEHINVHASALPRWRGAAPIERSLISGDSSTGVCIMKMEAGLDTGPVGASCMFDLDPQIDAGAVYEKCAIEATELLAKRFGSPIDLSGIDWIEQPESGATYASKITAGDRHLDIHGESSSVNHNRVRALSPHIGAWFAAGGNRVTVWKSTVCEHPNLLAGCPGDIVVFDASSGRVGLRCLEGAVELLEVQPAGRNRMSATAWIRGLREVPTKVSI